MNIKLAVITLLLSASFAFTQESAFTYQGRLTSNAIPASGNFDFQFILRDAPSGGTGLQTNQNAPVAVNNGLFTVTLDFGSGVFDGASRWLQIGVRTNGSAAAYTPLSSTQPITPTPYALHAADSSIPAGSIMAFMGTNAPGGWLLCDGSAVGRTAYARLFAVIGTASGAGDGSTTFNLPDLRATFLRGMDGDAEVDIEKFQRLAAKPGGNSGNALGSLQMDQFKSHHHANGSFNKILRSSDGSATTVAAVDVTVSEPNITEAVPMLNAGGTETRPRNIYVNFIIKQ